MRRFGSHLDRGASTPALFARPRGARVWQVLHGETRLGGRFDGPGHSTNGESIRSARPAAMA